MAGLEVDDDGSARLVLSSPAQSATLVLAIDAVGVVHLALDEALDPVDLGSVLVDEIVPHSDGVSYDMVATGGRLRVVAHDLEATWLPT